MSTLQDVIFSHPRIFSDNRGSFIKGFVAADFPHFTLREAYSTRSKKNVLRGLHFQKPPFDGEKIVSVSEGAILQVLLDLRPESATYLQNMSSVVCAKNSLQVYVPAGIAHGYLVLEDQTLVNYLSAQDYHPDSEEGIHWDSFDFDWGIRNPIVSDKDHALRGLEDYLRLNDEALFQKFAGEVQRLGPDLG